MTDNLKNAAEDLVCYAEMTVTKTEVKEELYDFEMLTPYVEFVNVKEEPEDNFEDENLAFIKGQSLNENLVSGSCQLRDEDIQKKQKLSKKRADLKHSNKAEVKNTLKSRTLVKQSGESKIYNCEDCEHTFHSKYHLERHIRTHTNERPFKCTYKNCKCAPGQKETCSCNTCGYAAALKDSLKVHVLAKHSEEPKRHKCGVCKYATHRKPDLKVHIRRHTNEKPFKCTYGNCDYAASQSSSLNVHILTKHTTEPKRYKCTDCMYTAPTKRTLEQHTYTHTNERPFKCTYKNCECTPGQENACKCNMCEYAARDKHRLKEHILAKHSQEPKKYNCAICKYATHRKGDLVAHIRTHTNNKQPDKIKLASVICAEMQLNKKMQIFYSL